MKQLFNLFKIASQTNRISTSLFNYIPQRGAKYESKIKWREPIKYKHYHPLLTGDTAAMEFKNFNEIHYSFRDAKELEDADEKVKKIFSLNYQKSTNIYEHYSNELTEKVKEHPLDNSSRSVRIAQLTARIRYLQNILNSCPKRNGFLNVKIDKLIGRRRAHLGKLRSEDYKKFEWILETLELQYKGGIRKECKKLNRKNSIIMLAKLRVEKIKEEKLAALKKSFDEQKTQFLERKLEKLKKIKETEEKFGLTPSVLEEDITTCMEQLEKVKIQVEENSKKEYVRDVHPYFLEHYSENLLQEKEKAAELLRENMKPKQPKRFLQGTSS